MKEVPEQAGAFAAFHKNALATAKGSGFLAGGSLFEFAGRFLIALLLARLLGPSDYGLYVLAISAAALFAGLSQLGLDDAMVRYVAILSGRGDREGVWGTIQIGLGISLLVGVATGLALFIAARPVAEGLFHEPSLTTALRFVALMVPFLTISNVLAGSARGFGRMDYAAFAENGVMSLVRLLLLVVLAWLGKLNLLGAVIVFGISDLAASITLILLLNKEFAIVELLRRDARRDFAVLLRFALPLWMSGILRQFRRNIETMLLGALAAASSVGIFAVVARVNDVGHVFLLSILLAVKPTLARLHDRGKHRELEHIYRTSTRWALTLYIPFFLVMVLYPTGLLTVFGAAFGTGATALIVLAFAELVNAATGICGPMIDMTGHVRIKLVNAVVWTVITIAANALLIPRWGVVGAAVAALMAIVAVNVLAVLEMWVLERLTPFDRSFAKPVAAGLVAFACGAALQSWTQQVVSFGLAALYGSIVGLIYVAVLVMLGLPTDDRMVLERLLSRVRALTANRRTVAVEKAG